MAQRTDLYTILLSYAHKHRSPVIPVDGFLSFLGKYAQHYAPERPEWRVWAQDTVTRFWTELNPLVEARKCEFHNEDGSESSGKLLILEYYSEIIDKAYETLETSAHLPFPDEKTLGLKIPQDQVRPVSIQHEMQDYMLNPVTANMPVIRVDFPDEQGSALFLAHHLPKRALEASLIKLQYYIQSQNSKDYFSVRLSTQFQGKDVLIRELMTQLENRPYECLSHIQDAGEFACLFWPYFGAQLRSELKKKNEMTSSDLAAIQSAQFLEFFVGHFRSQIMASREKEAALQEIEARLEKPPFLFTYKDILGWADVTGKLLADIYGQEDLERTLREKTTKVSEEDDSRTTLPPLVIFRNRFDEQVFILKDRVFPLVTKLLVETRVQIRKTLTARWSRLLRDFLNEPPMENDKDFERILAGYTAQLTPNLSMFLDDQKTYLIQAEMERSQGGVLQYTKLFDDYGKLLPMSLLLEMDRRTLVSDIRILLPVWYSIPIISAIIGFFKRLKRKKAAPAEEDLEAEMQEREKPKTRSGDVAMTTDLLLKKAAAQFQSEKVPKGQTVDQYLVALEKRWRKILDENTHRQMTRDVHSLIKKKLHRMLSIRTGKKVGVQTITEIADAVIFETPSFMDLDSTEAMRLYVALYISRLLKNP